MTPIVGKPETATLTKIAENPNLDDLEVALNNFASALSEFTIEVKSQTCKSIVESIMNPTVPNLDLVSVSDGNTIYTIYNYHPCRLESR